MSTAPGTNRRNDDEVVEERPLLTGDELAAFERDPTNRLFYGDEWASDPSESTIQCGFLNVNGLRKDKWKEKNNSILKFLFTKNFDITGLVETNLHWPSLPPHDSWAERVQGQWESLHSSMSYSTNDPISSAWQPRGCLQLSTDQMAHRVISSGRDPTGLGRWCWTRY